MLETQSVDGAVDRVETAGDIQYRITVSRLLVTMPFALKKKMDNRELYLTIDRPGAIWVIDVGPNEGAKARGSPPSSAR
ncbi:MAG: hypothetical protein NVS3B26_19730 [Mycobacteriales bacterium]